MVARVNRVGLNTLHSLFFVNFLARVLRVGQKDRKHMSLGKPPNFRKICVVLYMWDFQRETCANV